MIPRPSFAFGCDRRVFINNKLVIDLGGIHSELSSESGIAPTCDRGMYANSQLLVLSSRCAFASGEVYLNSTGPSGLNLRRGDTYKLSMFFAERSAPESHFRIDTTIDVQVCISPAASRGAVT